MTWNLDHLQLLFGTATKYSIFSKYVNFLKSKIKQYRTNTKDNISFHIKQSKEKLMVYQIQQKEASQTSKFWKAKNKIVIKAEFCKRFKSLTSNKIKKTAQSEKHCLTRGG